MRYIEVILKILKKASMDIVLEVSQLFKES